MNFEQTKFLTKNKNKMLSALAVLLMLTALSPLAANVNGLEEQTTDAYISVTPNPVGVGQEIAVTIWIHPYPPTALLDVHNFRVTITKPDGTTESKGPYNAFKSSSSFFLYTPTTPGIYKFKFDYPGEEYFSGSLHYAASTATAEVTVQTNPIPLWPETIATNDYWERPLSAANRQWYTIAGPWLNTGPGNEWSQDVKTPHVMWKTPIDIGGVVGGEQGISNYYNYHRRIPFPHRF
jgi:hypothetical protein